MIDVSETIIISQTQRLQPQRVGCRSLLLCRPYGVPRCRRWHLAAESKGRQPAATQQPPNALPRTSRRKQNAPSDASPEAKHCNPSAVELLPLWSVRRRAAVCRATRAIGVPTVHNAVYLPKSTVDTPNAALRLASLACVQPPRRKALRPPLHLSKRYAANRGALPAMRDSVRPLSVIMPQGTKLGRVSADGAARVGQSAVYKNPAKRLGSAATAYGSAAIDLPSNDGVLRKREFNITCCYPQIQPQNLPNGFVDNSVLC